MASITQAFKNNFVFNSKAALQAIASANLTDKNIYFYIESSSLQVALYDAASTAALSADVFKPDDITLPAPGRFFRQPKGYIESLSQFKNEIKQLLVYDTKTALLQTASNTFVDGQTYFFLSNSRETINLAVWKASSTATDNGTTILRPDDTPAAQPGRFFAVEVRESSLTSTEFVNLFKTELVYPSKANLLAQPSTRWVNNTVYFYLESNRIRMAVWKAGASDATTPKILRPDDLLPTQNGRFFVEDFADNTSQSSMSVAISNSLADILALPLDQLIDGAIYYYTTTQGQMSSVIWKYGLTESISDPRYYQPDALPAGRHFRIHPFLQFQAYFVANYTSPVIDSSANLVDGKRYFTGDRTNGILLLWDAGSTATVDNIDVFAAADNPATGRYLRQNLLASNIYQSYDSVADILAVPSADLVDGRIYYTDVSGTITVLQWDASSSATADGITIFEADNSTTGRFFKLPNPATPVGTLASVLAIATEDLVDGNYYYFQEAGILYVLRWDASSDANGDGFDVLKPDDMFDGRFVVNRPSAEIMRSVGYPTTVTDLVTNGGYFAHRQTGYNDSPDTFSLWSADKWLGHGTTINGFSALNALRFLKRVGFDPNFASIYMPFNFQNDTAFKIFHRYPYSPLPFLQCEIFDDYSTYLKYPYWRNPPGVANCGYKHTNQYGIYNPNNMVNVITPPTYGGRQIALSITNSNSDPSFVGGFGVINNPSFGAVKITDGQLIFSASIGIHADQYIDWAFGLRSHFDTSPISISSTANMVALYRRGSTNRQRLYLRVQNLVMDTGIDLNYTDALDAPSQSKLTHTILLNCFCDWGNSLIKAFVYVDGQQYEYSNLAYQFPDPFVSFFMYAESEQFTDSNSATKYGDGEICSLYHYAAIAARNVGIPTYGSLYDI